MYRVTLRLILVLLTFVPFMSARTVAAELSFLDLTTPSGPTRGKSYRNIMLEGEIANGDFAKLKALANGHNVAILTMRSPGGDVLEAIKIAEFLNRLISYGVAGFRVDAVKHM